MGEVYLALRSIKWEIEDLSNNPSGVSGSGEGGVANADLVKFYVTFLELLHSTVDHDVFGGGGGGEEINQTKPNQKQTWRNNSPASRA